MNVYVAPIVEGQTEQGCVERLLHRVWGELLHRPERLQVLEPFRGHRDALGHANGVALTESVQKAFLKLQAKLRKDAQAQSLLLILLDAEGDCPAELAPRLLETARQARRDATISCVLAKRMLENWIVAGASSLAGVNGLPDPLQFPKDPEDRSGSLWLNEQLRGRDRGRKYTKTADAAVFVRAMNLQECRAKSPSFDKLCRELEARLPRTEGRTGTADQAPPEPRAEGPEPSS
jgi:Domain of unknown function (DUF4276)